MTSLALGLQGHQHQPAVRVVAAAAGPRPALLQRLQHPGQRALGHAGPRPPGGLVCWSPQIHSTNSTVNAAQDRSSSVSTFCSMWLRIALGRAGRCSTPPPIAAKSSSESPMRAPGRPARPGPGPGCLPRAKRRGMARWYGLSPQFLAGGRMPRNSQSPPSAGRQEPPRSPSAGRRSPPGCRTGPPRCSFFSRPSPSTSTSHHVARLGPAGSWPGCRTAARRRAAG